MMYNTRPLVPLAVSSGSVTTPLPYSDPTVLPQTGNTAIRKNTIRLPAGSSSINNYYVGFDIILKKDLASGKTYTQRKRIVAYDGSTRIAVIDDLWDVGYEPSSGDSYELVLAYEDARISINPTMQVLDYVSSDRYGRKLDPINDTLLSTWTETARKCDAQSDVSLKMTSEISASAEAVYSLTEGSVLIWEGKVRATVSSSKYVNFTSVIGKITNKWNSWKTYKVGDIVYSSANRFYKVTTAGPKTTEPSHTSGTSNGLQFISSLTINKISGSGPTSLSLDIAKNPVVALNEAGEEISGYSLYDADSIDFWRYLGWDEHSQSSATLYQTNFTIDTSAPMFDNVNMMLEHFNGIFSYSEGKYTLDLEEMESEYIQITEEDIIGKISFEDPGSRSSYNSVTVSYSDPGNNFESRNISLFSKTYLSQDRNVPKKGNITVSGITNYYNVRLLADSYLKRSRYNSSITLTLFPEFIKLVAGDVIGITYRRYNWNQKPFRIDTLTINPNGTIGIVANEYHDSFYALTNMNKTGSVGNRSPITYTPIDAPTNIRATSTLTNNELRDGILVSWDNVVGLSTSTETEIYSSDTSSTQLTVSSISSGSTAVFSTAHGLKVGSAIRATSTGNGFVAGKTYFVKTRPSSTTLTFSETMGGATLVLTNGTGLNITFNPFSLVGSVAYPENKFIHTFANITESTVKYYRCRYKTIK